MSKVFLLSFLLLLFSASVCNAQSQYIDSLNVLYEKSQDPLQQLEIIVLKVDWFDKNQAIGEAITLADSGIQLAINLKDNLAHAKLLRLKTQIQDEMRLIPVDSAISKYLQAQQILLSPGGRRHISDATLQKELAYLINNLGLMYWRKGLLKESYAYYDSCLRFTNRLIAKYEQDSNLKRLYGRALNSTGAVLWGMGQFEEATQFYFKAVDVFKLLDLKINESLTLTNIGLVYRSLGLDAEAEKFFQQALTVAFQTSSNEPFGYVYHNLGRLKESQKELDSAAYYYDLSIKHYQATTNTGGLVMNLHGKGRLEVSSKNFIAAMSYFNESLKIAEESFLQYWIAHTYFQIGTAHMAQSKIIDAIGMFEKSRQVAEKEKYAELLKDIFKALSDAYFLQRNFEQALYNQQLSTKIKDSLLAIDQTIKVALIKEQYETAQKQKEFEMLRLEKEVGQQQLSNAKNTRFFLIAVLLMVTFMFVYVVIINRKIKLVNQKLKEKNDEISQQSQAIIRQTQALQKANETKNLLFSIVSHDIRGPIDNLSGLVNMLSMEMITPDEFKQYLPMFVDKVRYVKDLNDNMLGWARGQMDGFKAAPMPFDLSMMVTKKLPFYIKLAEEKGVEILNNIPANMIAYADQNMVEMVMRNLVSNAIKFTDAGGKIILRAEVKDNNLKVSVADSGMGMTVEQQVKIFLDEQFTTPGTLKEKGAGLGLMICQKFVKLNNGQIWVESKLGSGSTFYFTIPLRIQEN